MASASETNEEIVDVPTHQEQKEVVANFISDSGAENAPPEVPSGGTDAAQDTTPAHAAADTAAKSAVAEPAGNAPQDSNERETPGTQTKNKDEQTVRGDDGDVGGREAGDGSASVAGAEVEAAICAPYDAVALVADPAPSTVPEGTVSISFTAGMTTGGYHPLHLLYDGNVLHAVGNAAFILNTETGEQTRVRCIDEGGARALAVHPSGRWFAIGGAGEAPRVAIYSYPDVQLLYILSQGTEQAYAALAFSADGETLASVGAYPDYALQLWNWRAEQAELRAKAFSQEVRVVQFSPFDSHVLVTGGQGHIRFWHVAKTFTGRKLQGDTGKFGRLEISDVTGVGVLPDGKVVCGTERGDLLLWEGNMVKCELKRSGGRACHSGFIETLLIDWESDLLLTGAHDGILRAWSARAVESAEPAEGLTTVDIEATSEVLVQRDAQIISMRLHGGNIFVLDRRGYLWKVPFDTGVGFGEPVEVQSFFARRVVAAVPCASSPDLAVAASADGSVRVLACADGSLQHSRSFSSPITACTSLFGNDHDAAMIVTGHEDGTIRAIAATALGVALQQALRPHAQPILDMASTAARGGYVVTVSADGRTFFFARGSKLVLEPIGYVEHVAHPLTKVAFLPSGAEVVLAGPEGAFATATAPARDAALAASTYRLQDTQLTLHKARFPDAVLPPSLRQEGGEEGEREAASRAATSDDRAAADDEDVQERRDTYLCPGMPIFLRPHYAATSHDNNPGSDRAEIEIAYDGDAGGGRVFAWSARAEPHALRVALDCGLRVTIAAHVRATGFEAFAFRNGAVLLQGAGDLSWSQYVCASPHGGVAALSWSAASSSLLVFGGGAEVVGLNVGAPLLPLREQHKRGAHTDTDATTAGVPEPPEPSAHARAAGDAEVRECEDISDPHAYTLEEALRQHERDLLVSEAQHKKSAMRDEVAALRREYEDIVRQNRRAPREAQLTETELDIDPEYRAIVREEMAQQIASAKAALRDAAREQQAQLEALEKEHLGRVEVERIVLHSFAGTSQVSSIRALRMPERLQAEIDAVHALIQQVQRAREEEAETVAPQRDDSADETARPHAQRSPSSDTHSAANGNAEKETADTTEVSDDGAPAAAAAAAGAALDRGGSDQDVGDAAAASESARKHREALRRKRERNERAQRWEELMERKPDEKYEDPRDMLEIERARASMGNFHLKTDDDYVVPESLQVDAEKKWRSIVLLEEAAHTLRQRYNARFLALRDLKRRIVRNTQEYNARIRDIDASLGTCGTLLELSMRDDEEPERRLLVSDDDIDAYARRTGQLDLVRTHNRPTATTNNSDDDGEEDDNNNDATTAVSHSRAAPLRSVPGSRTRTAQRDDEAAHGGVEHATPVTVGTTVLSTDLCRKMLDERGARIQGIAVSPLEAAEKRACELRLQHERHTLVERIERTVEAFDTSVEELRGEKARVQADLKSIDARLLLYRREYELLREFEKQDHKLVAQRSAARASKAEVLQHIAACQERLLAKRAEIDRQNPAAVMAEFRRIVGESNRFYEPLLAIFQKKVKRSRGAHDDDGASDLDTDSDASDDEFLSGDESDEEVEDACPPHCDPSLYEKVLSLREVRLDQEEVLNAIQKEVQELKKENDALVKREKAVGAALHEAERAIHRFQTEKQRALNELRIAVPLWMHQVETVTADGALAATVEDAVVFTRAGLRRLEARTRELEAEKHDLRKRQRDLRREHVTLHGVQHERAGVIRDLEKRSHDVQMLKFGQLVSLEMFDENDAGRVAEAARARLARGEAVLDGELREWKRHVDEASDALAAATRVNTQRLNLVRTLTEERLALEEQLNATQQRAVFPAAAAATAATATRGTAPSERAALMDAIREHAHHISARKAEIALLRRKGGHVYAPSGAARAESAGGASAQAAAR